MTWGSGFEKAQKTFYEPGTELDTLEYRKPSHSCNKLRTVAAV